MFASSTVLGKGAIINLSLEVQQNPNVKNTLTSDDSLILLAIYRRYLRSQYPPELFGQTIQDFLMPVGMKSLILSFALPDSD